MMKSPALAAALLMCLGCTPQMVTPAPGDLELVVHYAGCSAVLEGRRCLVSASRALSLWVRTPAANEVLSFDGDPVTTKGLDVVRGRHYALSVPPGVRTLRVEATPATGNKRSFVLRLEDALPASPDLERAREWKGQGRYVEARELLEEILPGLSGPALGEATGLLARVLRALGDSTAAEQRYHEAIAYHRATGNLSGEVNDVTALVYVLIQQGRRFAEARKLLDTMQGTLPHHSDSRYLYHYYKGLLARKTEDHRSALRHLSIASREATRMQKTGLRGYADQVLAHSLGETGRVAEAVALLEKGLAEQPAGSGGCSRMFLLLNYGWEMLLQRDASPTPGAEVERGRTLVGVLEEALGLARSSCKGYPQEESNLLLNLALAAFHEQKLPLARTYLGQARSVPGRMTVLQTLWAHDIEGRLAMACGEFSAAAEYYRVLQTLAEEMLHPEGAWRALVGQAQATDALGDAAGAHALFALAEARLGSESLLVPVHAGRDLFLARRDHATGAYIDSLLRAGWEAEAFAVVRTTRSRLLQGLMMRQRIQGLEGNERLSWDVAMGQFFRAREAAETAARGLWELPAEELPRARSRLVELHRAARDALDVALVRAGMDVVLREAKVALRAPRPGELFLAFYQAPDGWVGFGRDALGLSVRRLGEWDVGESSREELALYLLQPFVEQIRRNSTLLFFPWGQTRALDFHALPFDGAPLMASKAVAYSLDLPRHAGRSMDERQNATTLVVADPRGDLPGARKEGAAVMRALSGRGARLLAGEDATAEGVRGALQRAGRFHYAGHGAFHQDDPWGASLALREDTELTIGDILALPQVPGEVVLTGCETARTTVDRPMETVGLAQAFLAAGAEAVVASTRPIKDTLGRAFAKELYGAAGGSLALRFQAAQRALRARGADEDWSSFRLMVP